MSQLLLVGNPIKRRAKSAKRRTTTKRKASPAQLRARAKFAAMSRARAKAVKARRTPRRKAVASRAGKSLRSNPIVAKRRSPKRRSTRAVARRTRRNPISGRNIGNSVMSALKSAGLGAAGAIGVDAAFGLAQSYLPVSMQNPTDATGAPNYAYAAAKGALAFGVAMAARKVIGAAKANAILQGSLTVTLHDVMKGFVQANVPSVQLARYVNVQSGQGSLGNSPGGRVVRLPSSSLSKYTSGPGSMQNAAARESRVR